MPTAVVHGELEKDGHRQPCDRELFDAACAGDGDAFRRLVEPYRAELHAHCRRMLRSAHDAQDAVQDAMLRAWCGLGGLKDHARIGPWLYAITTNVCIDEIRRRPKRAVPFGDLMCTTSNDIGEPLDHSLKMGRPPAPQRSVADHHITPEARYAEREALELACMAALHHLPCRQRLVLILREVLKYSAREVADLLETTVPSVNSALQRARKTVDNRMAAESTTSPGRLSDECTRDRVARFIEAFDTGDADAIVAALVHDTRVAHSF